MPTTVLTDRERAAVQAYVRLLQTVRATLDMTGPPATAAVVPPSLLVDADRALAGAGLAGNETEFFALLRAWRPAARGQ